MIKLIVLHSWQGKFLPGSRHWTDGSYVLLLAIADFDCVVSSADRPGHAYVPKMTLSSLFLRLFILVVAGSA